MTCGGTRPPSNAGYKSAITPPSQDVAVYMYNPDSWGHVALEGGGIIKQLEGVITYKPKYLKQTKNRNLFIHFL